MRTIDISSEKPWIAMEFSEDIVDRAAQGDPAAMTAMRFEAEGALRDLVDFYRRKKFPPPPAPTKYRDHRWQFWRPRPRKPITLADADKAIRENFIKPIQESGILPRVDK